MAANKVLVRYNNVSVEVQLNPGEQLTVDELLQRPTLKPAFQVAADVPTGLVTERESSTLLSTRTRVIGGGEIYLMVPVWRAEVQLQNSAGEILSNTTLNYLPDQVPAIDDIIEDLKHQFSLVKGTYALKRPHSIKLVTRGERLESGKYILCTSVNYRIRYVSSTPITTENKRPSSSSSSFSDTIIDTAVTDQDRNKGNVIELGDKIVELNAAFQLAASQLIQTEKQLVTTYKFPALFPDDGIKNEEELIRGIDTFESRQVQSDAVLGGDYVVLQVYKYVVRKPAIGLSDNAIANKREGKQVLYYRRPKRVDQILADLLPRVDCSSHLLYHDEKTSTSVKHRTKCALGVVLAAGSLVLEHIIPFTVEVPAMNHERLNVPVSPFASVMEILDDSNLLPLTQQSENAAQLQLEYSSEEAAFLPYIKTQQKPKTVVLAKGYDHRTKTLLDILSPVTLAQDIRTTLLYAGWDYAIDFTILSTDDTTLVEKRFRFPLSDNFDSLRRQVLSISTEVAKKRLSSSSSSFVSSPNRVKFALYSGLTSENGPIYEVSGPLVKNLKLLQCDKYNCTVSSLDKSSAYSLGSLSSLGTNGAILSLESLRKVQLFIPGYSESQARWIPEKWQVRNILRLLTTMFEFERRGFNPRRQVPMLYISGSKTPLLEHELFSTVDSDQFTVRFEQAIRVALKFKQKTHTATTFTRHLTRDALRWAHNVFPDLHKETVHALCVRDPKSGTLWAKGLDEPVFHEESDVVQDSTPLAVTHEIEIYPGINIEVVFVEGSDKLTSTVTTVAETINVCIPKEFTVEELQVTVRRNNKNENEPSWSIYFLGDPQRTPFAYTDKLGDLFANTSFGPRIAFQAANPVYVSVTYQNSRKILSALPDTASIRTMLRVASHTYGLFDGQEFEVIGKVGVNDLLRQHAKQNGIRSGVKQYEATFILGQLVRTHVIVYDDAKHIRFSGSLSANGPIEDIIETYREHLKLHPSCAVELFTVGDRPACVDPKRSILSFARPSIPEDYKHFGNASSNTIVELLAIHHNQQVKVNVYNLYGMGGVRTLKVRKFAPISEVAHAASLEFGHTGYGISSWSLVPHLSSTPLSADRPVNTTEIYDLVETTPSKNFIALRLFSSQNTDNNSSTRNDSEVVCETKLPISSIPGFESRFNDITLTEKGKPISNVSAPISTVVGSQNSVVPLYVVPKPDLAVTVTHNGIMQLVKQPIRNTIQQLLERLNATDEAIVTNTFSGEVVKNTRDLIIDHTPNFTFTVTDSKALVSVTIKHRKVTRVFEVNGDWNVRRLLATALQRLNLASSTQARVSSTWGLFLNSSKNPLHPDSIPIYKEQNAFILRRLDSSSSSPSTALLTASRNPAEIDQQQQQEQELEDGEDDTITNTTQRQEALEQQRRTRTRRRNTLSNSSHLPSVRSRRSCAPPLSSRISDRRIKRTVMEDTGQTNLYIAVIIGVVLLALATVALIL